MAFSTYRLNYLCTCGGNRSYGKTLYVFGTTSQNVTSTGSSIATTSDTQRKQLDYESQANKDARRNMQELEKVHKATLLEKEDTIANLRDVILEHEKRVLELEGNTSVRESLPAGRIHASPIQKLLDQIDRLQEEKDSLLRKIANFKAKEACVESPSYEVNEDLVEQSELSYQLESCTTDTEKELAKIKHVKSSLDREIQKLRKENAQLRDRLVNLGVDISDLMTTSVKSESSNHLNRVLGDSHNDILGDSEYNSISSLGNQIQYLQQELQHKTTEFYLGDSKAEERERKKLKDVLASVHHTTGLVFQEFLEVKKAYLALKQDVTATPLSLGEIIREMQLQVQKSLTDINVKYKEVVDKYLREMKLRKKYHNELVELRGNIRVLCRVRPWIKEDGLEENTIVVTLDSDDDSVIKINNKGRIQLFDVDKSFGTDSTQTQVFDEVSSLVRSVIDGYNVCIFAYGQTGSGKTYTMEGPKSNPGINQRALQLLFEETVDENWQYEISASVLEIYNEVIRDLLNPDQDCKLEVKMKPEGGLYVPGLVAVPVSDLIMVNQIFETGRKNRATASTNMNEHSSRSHCLLCVTVTGYNPTTGSKTLGRLNLVDLAGSERVSKSMADGIHLKEAQNINKSLSSLGDVIHALRNKHGHVPYRNSKLTYLLQDSLGGDSKTLMIVQVSPVEKNVSETVCTLTFGQRVRSVELGTATKNFDVNKSTPTKRPSSLQTSSLSVSVSSPSLASSPTSPGSNRSQLSPTSPLSNRSQLSPITPVSNRSPLSSSSPVSNRSALTTSLSSPSLNGRRQPSQALLKSTSSPPVIRKSLVNSKTPTSLSPLITVQKKTLSSSRASLSSPSSPISRKSLLISKSPTSTLKKLPQTTNMHTSSVTMEVQQFSRSSTVPCNLNGKTI